MLSRDRPPRQQPRLLEHEPDPRVRRRDRSSVERDRAAIRREQAGGDPQERRLAAAVRPDEGDDLAALDVERQPVERDRRGGAAGRRAERDPHVVATSRPGACGGGAWRDVIDALRRCHAGRRAADRWR